MEAHQGLGLAQPVTLGLRPPHTHRVRAAAPAGVIAQGNHAEREVVDAFFSAARRGDFAALIDLLDPQVELRADGPRGADLVHGAHAVAERALMFARPDATLRLVRAGDSPGVLVLVDGRPISMMLFTVRSGRVLSIHATIDRTRLAGLIPSWVR